MGRDDGPPDEAPRTDSRPAGASAHGVEAAVIAVPHPKWVERPLACVVPKPGTVIEPIEILDFLRPKLARWALPDEVTIIDPVRQEG